MSRSSIIHCVARVRERYYTDLTVDDYREMTRQIKAGKATPIGRQPDGSVRYVFPHNGRHIVVLYQPRLRKIVTVLPPHARRNRGGV